MRLRVEQMDATVVEVTAEGQVHLENGEWLTPTMQERRAIIYAAEQLVAELQELLDRLTTT